MANKSKARGDRAELEVQALIRELTGWPARRMLGAGRLDDMGDVSGVPETTIQVCAYADLARAVREKVPECVAQQERAQTTFGAVFVRKHGGGGKAWPSAYPYLVVMTAEMWATYSRASSA